MRLKGVRFLDPKRSGVPAASPRNSPPSLLFLSLSLDAPSLYNTTGEASLVNSPLYPYFDSGGHGALRNFAGCFAPRETNTPLSRSLLSSSLSLSLVPSFRFCLSIESFSTRFRIRFSFFIDWICFFFIYNYIHFGSWLKFHQFCKVMYNMLFVMLSTVGIICKVISSIRPPLCAPQRRINVSKGGRDM